MKKTALLFFFFVLISLFFNKSSYAGIWEDEEIQFCTVNVEYEGSPVTVRGAKIGCSPLEMSVCFPSLCKAMTRPAR